MLAGSGEERQTAGPGRGRGQLLAATAGRSWAGRSGAKDLPHFQEQRRQRVYPRRAGAQNGHHRHVRQDQDDQGRRLHQAVRHPRRAPEGALLFPPLLLWHNPA